MSADVVRLALMGLSNTEIAETLEIPRNRVGVLLFKARVRGVKVPKLSRSWVGLTVEERAELDLYAAEIGVSANWLARQVLMGVIRGGLTSIVLGGDPKEIYDENS